MKKRWIILLIAAALLLTAALILILCLRTEEQPEETDVSSHPSATAPETEATESAGAVTEQSETSEPTDGTAPTEMQQTEPPVVIPPTNATEPTTRTLSLPYTIANTGLVIQQVSAYSGAFLEDGSDVDISNVTAIVLKNTGETAVEYASITLTREDEALHFEVSALPAGATVVVQEADRKTYTEGAYTDCTADVAELASFEMSEDQVRVTENADHSLTVTNLTGEDIACVRIFYKLYMQDEDVYVGGITYNARLVDLPAGGSQTVTPSHYAKGYSRVVMVRTYDTAEEGGAS